MCDILHLSCYSAVSAVLLVITVSEKVVLSSTSANWIMKLRTSLKAKFRSRDQLANILGLVAGSKNLSDELLVQTTFSFVLKICYFFFLLMKKIVYLLQVHDLLLLIYSLISALSFMFYRIVLAHSIFPSVI